MSMRVPRGGTTTVDTDGTTRVEEAFRNGGSVLWFLLRCFRGVACMGGPNPVRIVGSEEEEVYTACIGICDSQGQVNKGF